MADIDTQRLDPYPTSKLGPPRYAQPPVARPRLLARLETRAPLLLIVAPAGAGKTALLASWTAARAGASVWYRLDPGDREPMRLVDGLAAAIEQALPGAGAAARVTIARGGSPFAALSLLLAALDEAAECVLVLDDTHHLDGARGAEAVIAELARARPSALRLILAGRTPPLIPAMAAVAAGELAGLGMDDLECRDDEAVALLAGHGLEAAATASLLAAARGWAMGLLLLAHAQVGHLAFLPHPTDALAEYLLSQVIDGLPDDLRAFLLESAVLGQFSAAEADAILGRADSARYIELVLRRGLFLERTGDERAGLVRYHDLFATTLAGALRREQPARFAELHERAAKARAGDPERMLAHLVTLADPPRLASALETLLPRLYRDCRWQTIVEYARLIPDEMHTVLLRRHLSFAHFSSGDLAAAMREADKAYTAAVAAGDREGAHSALVFRANPLLRLDRPEEALARCLPAIEQARHEELAKPVRWLAHTCGEAYLSLGRLAEGRRLFREVIAAWDAVGPEATNQLVKAMHDLAYLLLINGEDGEARAYLEDATARAREYELASLLVNCQATQAELLLVLGEYGPAATLAGRAVQAAREWGNDPALRGALLALAGACCHLGRIEEGLAALDQYAAMRAVTESPYLLGLGLAARAGLLLAAGDRARARAALDEAMTLQLSGRALGAMLTELGCLALAEGRPGEADRHLSEAYAALESRGARPAMARALLLRAEALWRLGKEARAVACLTQAGDLAHERGWLGGLSAEAAPALGAIRALASHYALKGAGRQVTEYLLRALSANRVRLVPPVAPSAPAPRPASAQPALRFVPFGEGAIERDGERFDLARLGGEKARELLAFAVWSARPVTREEILDALWDGANDERSQGALRTATYRIRRLLGEDAWVKIHGAYGLAWPVEDDYRRLLTLAVSVDDASAPLMERAELAARGLAFYSGEYLPWCSSSWVESPRQLASRAALTLIGVLLECRQALGETRLALEAAERGLEIEPVNETFRRAQIGMLIEQGRTGEAFAAYRAHAEALRDEGLPPPSRELRSLVAALRGASG